MPTRSPGHPRADYYSRLSHRPACVILQMVMTATAPASHEAPAFRFESRQRRRRRHSVRRERQRAMGDLPTGGVTSLLRP